jgi:hypothetical protein
MRQPRFFLYAILASFASFALYACVGDAPTDSATTPTGDASTGNDGNATSDSPSTTGDGGNTTDADSDCPTGSAMCGSTCIPVTADSANCGRCAHECGTGAKCAASICQPMFVSGNQDGGGAVIDALTTDQTDDNAAAVAVHVVYSQAGIFQDNAAGANRLELSTGSITSKSIVVHGSTVYWLAPTNPGGANQTIYQSTIGTAAAQTVAGTMQAGSLGAIVYDATDSLIVGSYKTGSGTEFGAFKCAGGGAACASEVSFTGTLGKNVATDGASLFYADSDNDEMEVSALAGGSSTGYPLAGSAGPTLVRVYGTGASGHLFWSNAGTPTLWRSSLSVSAAKQIASPATAADAIAVDALNIYWTESATGTISYAPSSGSGSTTTYVTMGASADPMLMVADKQFLYFTWSTGVYRVALP